MKEIQKIFIVGFISLCVALNLSIGFLVSLVKLPIYLDTIGTVLSSALAGIWIGVITGIVSNLLASFVISPTALPYALTSAVVAIVAGFMLRFKFLQKFSITILGGIVLGVVAAIVSAPITTYLYGGVSLAGADALTAFFKATGRSLFESVVLGGIITDIGDKVLTSIVVFLFIKNLPWSILEKFKNGKLFYKLESSSPDN